MTFFACPNGEVSETTIVSPSLKPLVISISVTLLAPWGGPA